jgi:hypothetical protein
MTTPTSDDRTTKPASGIVDLKAEDIAQVAGGANFTVAIDPDGGPGQFLRPPLPPDIPVLPFLNGTR